MEGELEDFLDEVDYVYNEIQKLKESPVAETPKLRASLVEKRRKQEEERRQRELELQYQGRPGHGEKFGTYESYCPRCILEFTVAVGTCPHCGKATMSTEERKADLTVKVAQLKEGRVKAAENKARWENWKKTEALLYRKTATNYRKWDYFEVEDEKEDELPFVPPEDPAFKEMERDMEERRIRRISDRKRAEELKTRGNELFKEGNLAMALEQYEEAQKIKRDMMVLYTNSALVRIKLKDFEKAIEDCNRVLEYCEVFEDGYKRSPDLCFKALTRRAMANRGRGKPSCAVDDLTQALTLQKDKEAENLLRRCREEARLAPAAAEEEQDGIEEVTDADALISALQSEPELLRFVSRGGYESLCHQVYLRHNRSALKVLSWLCSDPSAYLKLYPLTKRVKGDINGVVRLIRAAGKGGMDANSLEMTIGVVATATENAEVREELMEQCVNARKWKITLMLHGLLIAADKTQEMAPALQRLIAAISNLCLTVKTTAVAQTPNPGDMKDVLFVNWEQVKSVLIPLFPQQQLTATIFSLLCNLAIKPELRTAISEEPALISAAIHELETAKHTDVLESGLGLLINCMTKTSTEVDFTAILRVVTRCMSFLKSTDVIQQRAMCLASRLVTYREETIPQVAGEAIILKSVLRDLDDSAIYQHSLKVMIQCCRAPGFVSALPHAEISRKTAAVLRDYAEGTASVEMAGNSALLICRIVDADVNSAGKYSALIPLLIKTVGEKADIVRKNCALAIGRLAKDPNNLEQIRELHGMDVLRSIAGFVLD